jgi:hypothetical protein
MKHFHELSDGKPIVAMVSWCGILVVATGEKLYAVMKDGTAELMSFTPVGELAANGQSAQP